MIKYKDLKLFQVYRIEKMNRISDRDHWHWSIVIKIDDKLYMTIGSKNGKMNIVPKSDFTVAFRESKFEEIPNKFAFMALMGHHNEPWVSYVIF